jgi:hypothetical protein
MAKHITILVAAVLLAGSVLAGAWIIRSSILSSSTGNISTTTVLQPSPPERDTKRPDNDRRAPQPTPAGRYPLVQKAGNRYYYKIGDYYVCKEEFPDGQFPQGEPIPDKDGMRKFTIRLGGTPFEFEEVRLVYKFSGDRTVDRYDEDTVKGKHAVVPGLTASGGGQYRDLINQYAGQTVTRDLPPEPRTR